ncbi:MAG: 16S rRNA (cytidine(1402)-2'-O)-methyltransferase [Propionibacteriaceae bacterium]|jgi:16S rRNA (cytidine1402-2'-O)-methyltransferase|nr:16S rRNA (cytidine(1402)-2'-O)-methyltransferase [Propionibacteriaceae bacterium]
MSSRLVLAGTPIGNLADASPALIQVLTSSDVIAAEDTRRLRKLLAGLGVTTDARVVSFFDANEAQRAEQLVEDLLAGSTVVVVTDAGMPTVSDPGYRLVRQAIARDIAISVIPGPSAVLVSLALSGLPTDRFCFEGFMPRKSSERNTRLAALKREERTMVFFEAPHRLKSFLSAAAAAFGDVRQAAVCRELTKVYEEVKRGTLAQLAAWAAEGVKGEISVVIAGAQIAPPSQDDALAEIISKVAAGQPLSAAVAEVAAQSGLSRRELYQAALAWRNNAPLAD